MTANSERPRLREYRLQLGWTQQELAERLAHLAWMLYREDVAVNADMIAKWERGVKGVSRRYRELLCRLFGTTPEQLGLKNTAGPAAVRDVPPREDESLVSMLDNAAHLLDQLGAALAPHLLHAWKDAVTTRRTMLGLLDPAATDPAGHARAATADIADLEHLAEHYQTLYETADPAALMTPVAAHVRMTAEALRRTPTPEERRRLLRNQAQVAILAGRLAAEDLGNPLSGRAYYALALDTAREGEDDHLTALAHGYRARPRNAHHRILARHHRGHHPRRPGRARHSAPGARPCPHRPEPTHRPPPAWFHDGGTETLAAATGHVLLQAGDHSGARTTLPAALGQLRPTARRQRVLLLVDLATVELHNGDLPAACSHATDTALLLHHAAYAIGAARLNAFRAAAAPLNGRALRSLDEHLSRIAA